MKTSTRAVILGGLLVAVIGLGLVWWGGEVARSTVPPGLVILPLALLVPIIFRGMWGSALPLAASIALLAMIAVDGLPRGELPGGTGTAAAAGQWLQIVGLVVAAIASLAGLREGRAYRDPVLRKAPLPPERVGIWRLVVLLLVLAPVCAEYLAAYDHSTGDALALLAGLLIFVPLYGAPALLIREVGRRVGIPWAGMLMMGAAFGVLQAGIVDQSLFSDSYRGLEEWETLRGESYIPVLGFSLHQLVNFVGGHAIYSICAPIVLVEALRPGMRRKPWLGTTGVLVAAALYATASWLVLRDHLVTEADHASTMQLVGSGVVVVVLTVVALLTGSMGRRQVERRAPSAGAVFVAAFVAACALELLPAGWLGSAGAAAVLIAIGSALLAWSRRRAWGLPQEVGAASGFVLSRALLAFTYFPIFGEVEVVPKFVHNGVLLAGIALICMVGYRRAASHPGAAMGR